MTGLPVSIGCGKGGFERSTKTRKTPTVGRFAFERRRSCFGVQESVVILQDFLESCRSMAHIRFLIPDKEALL